MKTKKTSRAHIRRQIRKANRIARVDIEQPKRIRRRIILIILIIVFLVGEGFALVFAKKAYEYNLSVDLAEEMVIQLSLIDSALRTGDRAVYDKAYAKFHQQLLEFSQNNHVRSHAQDLANRLATYHNILLDNSELEEIINLHTATMKISNSANSVETQALDSKNIAQTKQDFEALLFTLEQIQTPELAELKNKAIDMTKEYIAYLNNAAVCIGVCASGTIAEKQVQLQSLIEKYLSDFEKLDAEYSDPYNPNLLIIELSKYSKI